MCPDVVVHGGLAQEETQDLELPAGRVPELSAIVKPLGPSLGESGASAPADLSVYDEPHGLATAVLELFHDTCHRESDR